MLHVHLSVNNNELNGVNSRTNSEKFCAFNGQNASQMVGDLFMRSRRSTAIGIVNDASDLARARVRALVRLVERR